MNGISNYILSLYREVRSRTESFTRDKVNEIHPGAALLNIVVNKAGAKHRYQIRDNLY